MRGEAEGWEGGYSKPFIGHGTFNNEQLTKNSIKEILNYTYNRNNNLNTIQILTRQSCFFFIVITHNLLLILNHAVTCHNLSISDKTDFLFELFK